MPPYAIVLIVIGSLLLLFALILWIASALVAKMIYAPKRYSREEQKAYNAKMGWDKGVEPFAHNKPIEWKMKDGYVIHGDYDLMPGSKLFCLLAHGHQTSREGARRYAALFRKLGFSTIVYDERGHGDNERVNVTMGKNESLDLASIIDQIYAQFGPDITLGLQGVSMGASTVILSTQYNQRAAFLVSDCAFSSLQEVVGGILKKHHIPSKPFLSLIDKEMRRHAGFCFKDVEIAPVLGRNRIPSLYIHGSADTYVDPASATLLSASDPSSKGLIFFQGAPHASSITIDREKYQESLRGFLTDIKVL